MKKHIPETPSIAVAAILLLAGPASAADGDNSGQYTFAPPSVTKQAATESSASAGTPPTTTAPTDTAGTAATAPTIARTPAYPQQGRAGMNGYYPPAPPRPYYNRGGPWNGGGPWGGGAPWGGNGPWGGGPGNWFGGRGGPWGGGPGAWMNPGNPKRSMSNAWDDMLNAPSRMGTMPGGWQAPSISVPNPVDVGDEFSRAARDLPGQMRNLGN